MMLCLISVQCPSSLLLLQSDRCGAKHNNKESFHRAPFSCFETPSLPKLCRRYPRGFTFYLGIPFLDSWIETRSLPALTRCYPAQLYLLGRSAPFAPFLIRFEQKKSAPRFRG